MEKAKATRLNEQEEEDRASRKSRHLSRASSLYSSASSVRAKALAEAAAAKKQAEYDRIMAEKELERRQREAEEERLREGRRAKYDRDMALLAAEKLTAVADAKLDVIEKSMEEEERSYAPFRKDMYGNAQRRTQEWVDAQENTEPVADIQSVTPPEVTDTPNLEKRLNEDNTTPVIDPTPLHSVPKERPVYSQNTSPPQMLTPLRDVECMETIITTNKQLTASLARQSLPKCHPDTFGGDATLFHPWKSAFKAKLQDANIPQTRR